MTTEQILANDQLIAKPYLTVEEMTRLIASTVGQLPTVAKVDVADAGELSVALRTGMVIEMQTAPVARAFNKSLDTRRQALDELVKSCA